VGSPPIVSDVVGLLWRGGEDGCWIVNCTRLACLTMCAICHSSAHLLIAFDYLQDVTAVSLLHFWVARQGYSCVFPAVGLSIWTYANDRI